MKFIDKHKGLFSTFIVRKKPLFLWTTTFDFELSDDFAYCIDIFRRCNDRWMCQGWCRYDDKWKKFDCFSHNVRPPIIFVFYPCEWFRWGCSAIFKYWHVSCLSFLLISHYTFFMWFVKPLFCNNCVKVLLHKCVVLLKSLKNFKRTYGFLNISVFFIFMIKRPSPVCKFILNRYRCSLHSWSAGL